MVGRKVRKFVSETLCLFVCEFKAIEMWPKVVLLALLLILPYGVKENSNYQGKEKLNDSVSKRKKKVFEHLLTFSRFGVYQRYPSN